MNLIWNRPGGNIPRRNTIIIEIRMDLKIEKDVPIPHTATSLLESMKVGDSVVCNLNECNRLRASAQNSDIKVMSRKLEDNSYRLWRVK